jgi:hypothetical protein
LLGHQGQRSSSKRCTSRPSSFTANDYGGPYAAFVGAATSYLEVDRMVDVKIWKYVVPPWLKDPQLTAQFVTA